MFNDNTVVEDDENAKDSIAPPELPIKEAEELE
jgi:hypothetical protein